MNGCECGHHSPMGGRDRWMDGFKEWVVLSFININDMYKCGVMKVMQ
jgi:hypothetical protein